MIDVEIRESLGDLKAVADLDPITGASAELVVHGDIDDEVETSDDLVQAVTLLISQTIEALARLQVVGEVRFEHDVSPEYRAEVDQALADLPQPVVITLEFCRDALQRGAEAMKAEADSFKRLLTSMGEEGLRRGLDREERDRVTLRDLFHDTET